MLIWWGLRCLQGQIKIFNVSGFEYSDKSKVGMEAKPSINEKEFAVLLKLLQATGSARESFGCVRRWKREGVSLYLPGSWRRPTTTFTNKVTHIPSLSFNPDRKNNPGKTKDDRWIPNGRIHCFPKRSGKRIMSGINFKGQNRIPCFPVRLAHLAFLPVEHEAGCSTPGWSSRRGGGRRPWSLSSSRRSR